MDGIRGLAILLVLIWHFAICRYVPPPNSILSLVWSLFGTAWSGVDLFFVLSGFLIGGILLKHRESPCYFKTFYIRRICRIFPPYFFVLLLFYLGVALDLAEKGEAFKWLFQNPLPFWSYATFTQNFVMLQQGDYGAAAVGVTWSLAVEEQFYLLFPLTIRYVPARGLPYLLIGGILLAPICRIALSMHHPATPAAGGFFMMPGRADALMLGALAAYAFHSRRIFAALMKNREVFYTVFMFLAAGVVAMNFMMPDSGSPGMTYWGRSLLALFFVSLLFLPLLNPHGFFAAFLRTRWLRELGIVSYGVYLLHQLVFGLLSGIAFRNPNTSAASNLMLGFGAVALTIGIAFAMYHLLEKPILRIGKGYQF